MGFSLFSEIVNYGHKNLMFRHILIGMRKFTLKGITSDVIPIAENIGPVNHEILNHDPPVPRLKPKKSSGCFSEGCGS